MHDGGIVTVVILGRGEIVGVLVGVAATGVLGIGVGLGVLTPLKVVGADVVGEPRGGADP